jgi:hypothetical protein
VKRILKPDPDRTASLDRWASPSGVAGSASNIVGADATDNGSLCWKRRTTHPKNRTGCRPLDCAYRIDINKFAIPHLLAVSLGACPMVLKGEKMPNSDLITRNHPISTDFILNFRRISCGMRLNPPPLKKIWQHLAQTQKPQNHIL